MFAEILDGTFYVGCTLPLSKYTYLLREIVQTKTWDGERIWVKTGRVFLESNSLSDVKEYCREHGITLVRTLKFYWGHRPRVKYEDGMEKLREFAVPNDKRTELPVL
jgi:hypothetical protein